MVVLTVCCCCPCPPCARACAEEPRRLDHKRRKGEVELDQRYFGRGAGARAAGSGGEGQQEEEEEESEQDAGAAVDDSGAPGGRVGELAGHGGARPHPHQLPPCC